MSLPRLQDMPTLQDAPNKAPKASMRVLVVDDDPVYRETARMFLGMQGRRVTVAENGTMGLAQLDSAAFDIMIVDMEMPDMTGLEVIARARKNPALKDMPIIMVTSRDDAMAIDRAYELGASSFVVKPVNWTLIDHYLRFVRRAANNEASARKAQAEAENLARTKDNLLAVLRHEMKTPLNAIVGFTRLATEARANGDLAGMNEHLAEVTQSGKRLLECLADMSVYSDLISGRSEQKPEPVAAGWLIDDALDANAAAIAASGIAVIRDQPNEQARVRVDAAQVGQALARVIVNAIQHAAGAGRIEIGVETGASGTCILSVSDDGQGMEPAALQHVLEPFAQGDMSLARPNQGLGLGLPITLETLKANGGTMVVNTRPGAGMRVELHLPGVAG